MTDFVPTARTKIKRLPKRVRYDRKTVYEILDAGFVCHIGYVLDRQPTATPSICAASVPARRERSASGRSSISWQARR